MCVLIKTNYVPEGNSTVRDMLSSLDNGPHLGMSEQTDDTKPAGQGELINTQQGDAIWCRPPLTLIHINQCQTVQFKFFLLQIMTYGRKKLMIYHLMYA